MPPSRIQIAKASSSNGTATPLVHRLLDREFVVPALQVLYEAMPGDHDPGAAILLEAPHRTKPCLQPTMIAFDSVIGVAVGAMPGRWQQLLQHDWVGGCLVGDDLHRVIFVAPSARSKNRGQRPRRAVGRRTRR
jgi:hypothetical protein